MKLTKDAPFVLRKFSTWLALLAAASSAATLAYAQLPERIQLAFPDWTLLVMGGASITLAALVPIATSLQQKSIPE